MKSRKILFIGDSLIEFFNWPRRFPVHQVWSRGRAGETVAGLLSRLPELGDDVWPDLVVIMTGTNDVGMENFGFISVYGALIDALQKNWPEAEILINSLMPFHLDWITESTVPRMNEKLADLAREKGICYLNVYPLFLDQQGRVIGGLFLEDEVHLSDEGYRVWSGALERFLE
ncbi:GDSL-type esterase/lipase family protein [Thermodesulfobacteriota bacterium]